MLANNYLLILTGTSGSSGTTSLLTHSIIITIVVTAQAPPTQFTLDPTPVTLTIQAGEAGTVTISLNNIGGFAESILLITPAPGNIF